MLSIVAPGRGVFIEFATAPGSRDGRERYVYAPAADVVASFSLAKDATEETASALIVFVRKIAKRQCWLDLQDDFVALEAVLGKFTARIV